MGNYITVYRHRKKGTSDVFYIGIGSVKRRPYVTYNRSKYWTNIYKKHGRDVDILAKGVTWEEALELEAFLISLYGRRDNGTGCLVNLTDGGEGNLGGVVSESTRIKMSKARRGKKLSKEHCKSISKGNKGKIFSDDHINNLKASRNKRSHMAWYDVLDVETGIFYNSINELAKILNIKYSTLYFKITKTTIRYKLLSKTEAQKDLTYITD